MSNDQSKDDSSNKKDNSSNKKDDSIKLKGIWKYAPFRWYVGFKEFCKNLQHLS